MRQTITIGALVALVGGLACADPTVSSAPGTIRDPSRIYARLDLSYHAITLRVEPGFDTMTLQAIPRTATGAALVSAHIADVPVSYRVVNNHPSLIVSAAGKLQAKAAVSRVLVIASQTIEAVTFVDTAIVTIVNAAAPRPAIASLSIQPLPGDSAKVDCSSRYTDTLLARPMDAVGTPISGAVLASYRSSDPKIATISATGVIQGFRPGMVTMFADAYIAGQGFRDSVRYTISDPLVQVVWLVSSIGSTATSQSTYASPGDVIIAVGGSVYWMNASTKPTDILFDEPDIALPAISGTGFVLAKTRVRHLATFDGCAAAGGGNIPALQVPIPFYLDDVLYSTTIPCASAAARRFATAGTYTYHSTDGSIVGRVMVR